MPTRVLLSWAWFFLVLFSYYVLKPLRDGLATENQSFGGLYLGTFLACSVALPLYWRIVAATSRWRLVLGVHQFFVACLVVFALLLHRGYGDAVWLRHTFFIWVSVYNVYVVAVFWSVMADLYSADDGKRWFGTITAAGTVGSIAASAVAGMVAEKLGTAALLVLTIVALELALVFVWWILKQERRGEGEPSAKSASGSLVEGLRTVVASRYLLMICAFVAIGKFSATFVYNNVQHVLRAELLDLEARTELFANISFYSQSGTLLLQGLVVGFLMRWLGLGATLAIAASAIAVLFGWLALDASLWPLQVAKAVQEMVGYGLLVPAQQVLFTVVTREEKYQSKAFVDTVVFRGSDVAAANACDALARFPLSSVALGFLPLIAAWAALGAWLGREQSRLANNKLPSVKSE